MEWAVHFLSLDSMLQIPGEESWALTNYAIWA